MTPSLVAFVPARSGSERVPGKNIRPLGGHPLLANNFVRWINFPLIRNQHWSHGNTVLLGDALHTAHFSIGSGTKLALEDSIALARCFAEGLKVPAALHQFEQVRKPVVESLQEAAFSSLLMLENIHEQRRLCGSQRFDIRHHLFVLA